MGVIRNQSITNSINLYLGIVIGAINTILIFPYVFESNPEYWGLLQILVSYSLIFSTFSHLGSPHIMLRYFPKANNKSELIGIVQSGGFSSKFSFLEHLIEETKIRIDNKQNIFIILMIIINSLIKKFLKLMNLEKVFFPVFGK